MQAWTRGNARAVGVATVIMILALPGALSAQVGAQGTAAISLGGWSNRSLMAGAAGGGELILAERVLIGGEASLLGATGELNFNLSLDGRVRLTRDPRTGRINPYVLAGGSKMMFLEGTANAWDVGAGVDYRLPAGGSLRVEFRDLIRRDFPTHYWAFRVGMTFR